MIELNKEYFEDLFYICGLDDLEILIPILKTRIDEMLLKFIDLIKMYETADDLKGAIKAINGLYETKERIEKLLSWEVYKKEVDNI